jgi:hypothetical protein
VRDYFGEKIAFYFAFIEELTSALIIPSIAGGVVLSAAYIYDSADNPLAPLYSMVVLVWITWFIKRWTRRQHRLAYGWNVEHFEEQESARCVSWSQTGGTRQLESNRRAASAGVEPEGRVSWSRTGDVRGCPVQSLELDRGWPADAGGLFAICQDSV